MDYLSSYQQNDDVLLCHVASCNINITCCNKLDWKAFSNVITFFSSLIYTLFAICDNKEILS